MVTIHGQASTGNTHPGQHIPLPRADVVRRAHRPWCADCKVTHDADQLDDHGRCPKCGPVAEQRAAAAERRRVADLEDARAARTVPRPSTPPPGASRSRPAEPDESPDALDDPVAPVVPAQARAYRVRALDTHRTEVIRRYREGHSANAIGADYGVSHVTVLNYLRAHGVPIRIRGRRPTAS